MIKKFKNPRPIISAIAAVDMNMAIGKDNDLLWQIPHDMRRFRQLTMGEVVIMGGKTYRSIGKGNTGLKGRRNIIISRSPDKISVPVVKDEYKRKHFIVRSVEDALRDAKSLTKSEVFIIGGGQIYEQTAKYWDRVYLTLILDKAISYDTLFPNVFQTGHWEIKKSKTVSGRPGQYPDCIFLTMDRRN